MNPTPAAECNKATITSAMIEAGIESLRDHEALLGSLSPTLEEILVQEILETSLAVALQEGVLVPKVPSARG